jgi:hypothetical protein
LYFAAMQQLEKLPSPWDIRRESSRKYTNQLSQELTSKRK